jgi:hypothetical protein
MSVNEVEFTFFWAIVRKVYGSDTLPSYFFKLSTLNITNYVNRNEEHNSD